MKKVLRNVFIIILALIFLPLLFPDCGDEEKQVHPADKPGYGEANTPKLTDAQLDSINESRNRNAELVKTQERKKVIESQFSSWDGSHINLKRLIKENMNDPSSFEHVETRYSDKGDYILVSTKFRGNNAFGAKILNVITAKTDIEGNLIEIVKD